MGHQMVCVSAAPDEQLYECPVCDRRLVVHWRPFRRTVLTRGDELTPHHGFNGPAGVTLAVNVDVGQ